MTVPRVTLHFAQSLDGRIGLRTERERTILSSREGLVWAHRARGAHDAVLIGIETLLHDDPLLTAREGALDQPLRVVLDSALRTPLTARLLHAPEPAGRVVLFGAGERAPLERQRALERSGAEVCLTPSQPGGRVNLVRALEMLAERGVKRLLVEGGARVLTSFLQARLAGRAEVEIAPFWLGEPATPALGELAVGRLSQAVRLEGLQIEPLGRTFLVRADIVYSPRGPA